jgi:TonB family protein
MMHDRLASLTMAAVLLAGSSAGEEPLRVSPDAAEPRLVKFSRPEHPEEAKRAGLQGLVAVECTVDEDGRVVDAVALQGDPPLSDAVLKAVKKWRYEPLEAEGRKRSFIKTVRVNFVSQETMTLDGLIKSLSSHYEAVRESAAIHLGRLFTGRSPSSHSRWTAKELKALLEREESPRVRKAAQDALAGMATK